MKKQWFMFQTGLMLVAGVSPGAVMAGDLKTPIALENTATLPAGVRNPRFINVFAWVGTRFADDGGVEPLGQPLNKVVTWRDVLEAQKESGKLESVGGLLRSNRLTEDGSPGSTTGEVNTFADVKVAALAFGVTDRLTIAGVLPIMNIQVSASTGFVTSAEGNLFVQSAAERSSPLTADEAANKLTDAVNQKLIRLGYDTIPASQTISGVGDAQLVAKYRLHDDAVNAITLRGSLVFPTGKGPDADKALDIPLGDDRLGVGAGAIYDRKLPWDFRLNAYGTYSALLPRKIVRRIPTSVSDNLSADKEEMRERLRSQFAFGTGVDHVFPSTGITLGGGYSFQFQTHADYEPGDRLEAGRYELLSRVQPLQAMHSLLVTAGFSTVEWFKQKKFLLPFQVNLAYTHPLLGRNVAANDLVAGELVMFF